MSTFRTSFKQILSLPQAFWVVIGATLMNQMGNMVMVFLILYLNQQLGFSLLQASTAYAVFSVSMLTSGLIGGGFIDRIGAARMLPTTLIINSLVLFLFPLFHHFIPILILCIGWGGVYGFYRPVSQTLVSQLSSSGLHKITFSLHRLALNLGMSIGPAVGGYLAAHSFKAIFYANGLSNLLAGIILLIGLRGTGWLAVNSSPPPRKVGVNLRLLKTDPALLIFMLGMIPICMIFYQHVSTLAVFLHRDLNLPLSFYGLLFTFNTLIIVFFELALNIAMLHWPYRINFMLGSLLITAGFAGLYFATTAGQVIWLTLFWTLGEMILYPAASSYIAEIAPSHQRGSYMSFYGTCSNLGMLLGPWSGALLMEHTGASGLWLACGLWGVISVVIFNRLPEPDAAIAVKPILDV